MERRFGTKLDPAVASTERESREYRRIQGGDAAKAAEDSAEERSAHQEPRGITLRATGGVKFEFEKRSGGPGEALPISNSSEQNNLPSSSAEPRIEEPATGITKGLLRRLFRP